MGEPVVDVSVGGGVIGGKEAGSRGRLRRSWPVIAVAIVALILLFWQNNQSVEVQASYVLESRADVTEIRASWVGERGKEVHYQKSFSERVPRRIDETLSLPPDTYRVRVTVDFGDGTSQVHETKVEVEEAGKFDVRVPGR